MALVAPKPRRLSGFAQNLTVFVPTVVVVDLDDSTFVTPFMASDAFYQAPPTDFSLFFMSERRKTHLLRKQKLQQKAQERSVQGLAPVVPPQERVKLLASLLSSFEVDGQVMSNLFCF